MKQKTMVYLFLGGSVALLTALFAYEFRQKGQHDDKGRSQQKYVEMPDGESPQLSDSKSHAYSTFSEEKPQQDIEDFWNQCSQEQVEKKEERKAGDGQDNLFTPSNTSGGFTSTPLKTNPTYTNPYRETAQEREERHQRRREEAIEMAERMREGDVQEGKVDTPVAESPHDEAPVTVTRTNVISHSDDGWGTGISSLGAEPETDITDERPFKCMFSRQEKIKSGQRVAVILLEEIRVNGVIIPKNTHLMGTCTLSSRLELKFESIEIGGRILPLGYEAYDMDGSKGIYCPDVTNVGKAARERGTDIARSTLSSRLGRVAQDVVSTGVSIARSSSGESTVTVPSGYSFFIVKKKEL